jgi:hypothetical protein
MLLIDLAQLVIADNGLLAQKFTLFFERFPEIVKGLEIALPDDACVRTSFLFIRDVFRYSAPFPVRRPD